MRRLHEETLKEGISRRRILRAGVAVLPLVIVGRALLPGRPAAAQQKATKQQVQYQESPKAGQECAKCLHFIAPDGCKLAQVTHGAGVTPGNWLIF
jgi:hypothetical protein